ncbi:hypothetical protein AN641_06285 [Candidatus Epulonipiscioides gigas]|nr:hypothetical protein AN641_06285 [Epulopiscium sp. SCG-C07WGA-EpuloA2]
MNIKKIKKLIPTIGIIFLMVYLLLQSKIGIEGATLGLLLWFNKVLPSLLPFMILSKMLFKLKTIFKLEKYLKKFSKKYLKLEAVSLLTFILGSLGGSPTGAFLTKDLLNEKRVSKTEALKVLCFSNNTGPLFIIGTVGTILLNDSRLGWLLVCIHILSALVILSLTTFYTSDDKEEPDTNYTTTQSSNTSKSDAVTFDLAFTSSVRESMETILYVGGFIIFFSVIINMLKHFPGTSEFITALANLVNIEPKIMESLLFGSLEFSNGAALIAGLHGQYTGVLPFLSAMISFGGLCVYFQTSQIVSAYKIRLNIYFISKITQAVFAYLITIFLYPIYQQHILKFPANLNITSLLLIIILWLIIVIILNIKSDKKVIINSTSFNKKTLDNKN